MGVVAYLSLSGSGRKVGCGGRLFEVGRLLTFSAFRMGAYSRWALIRGWALIRINTVVDLNYAQKKRSRVILRKKMPTVLQTTIKFNKGQLKL